MEIEPELVFLESDFETLSIVKKHRERLGEAWSKTMLLKCQVSWNNV